MKNMSIDDCINHLIECCGKKVDCYPDGTDIYEFRHKKKALIINSYVLGNRITHIIYRGGINVYFSQSFDGKAYNSDRNHVSGWRKDVRNLAKTVCKQEYLPGI